MDMAEALLEGDDFFEEFKSNQKISKAIRINTLE